MSQKDGNIPIHEKGKALRWIYLKKGPILFYEGAKKRLSQRVGQSLARQRMG